jgi:hypothetical protein
MRLPSPVNEVLKVRPWRDTISPRIFAKRSSAELTLCHMSVWQRIGDLAAMGRAKRD